MQKTVSMKKVISRFELSAAIDLMNKDQNTAAMLILKRYPDDAECQVRMAEIIYGDSSQPDHEERAFALFKISAAKGHAHAYFYLGYFYECGIGVEPSLEDAKAWYLKCIDYDSSAGLSRLAGLYARGVDGMPDHVQAYRYYYLSYIASGQPKALVHMDDMLYCMTREQHERALSLADDWIEAQYKLQIKGLDQDVDQVLQTEADFDYVKGNCETSLTFLQTKQVLRQIKGKQFDAATDLLQNHISDAFGQFLLGLVNYSDEGRQSGKQDSIQFFTAAAIQGCPFAFFRLGHCIAEGLGTNVNVPEAVRWYTKAALMGDSVAQHNLAQLHYRCVDLPRDYVSAYKWFFLSLAHGCRPAEHQYVGLINK
ncbi:tetratricopeptide repeat protein, partial [Limnohabitans sp.]|uniref:tetratricopeptide repeat protein n=1 Tax=Limnohabitans sp. TaxID=1907725 RepID=UPI0038BA2648